MERVSKAYADEVMSERGWLPLVPEAFRTEVLRRAMVLHLAPGEPVFHLGDPPGGVYGLVAGTVSVSLAPADATPRLILLGVPGHWTGEGCFLTRTPRKAELRAVVETTMLHLPLDAMDQMAARDPAVVNHVALMLMMTVEFLFRVIHDLQKPQADRRIASVLQRTTWIGQAPIPLTQSELGVMANASRKQVNAAIRRFAEAGWLSNTYRSITITDPGALRRFAEGEGTD
ncbi:Crp/Fnr family transcriptional regulator [Chelatococcus asaccharovorans]|uniref:CRP-like cAMP-binding protein n=2 Tax=Chelatococcus asaccharovorans TaxID=28210 RepID=A0A2V3UHT6_9HYPH|nr:Crp/Fnr family transcriptional regulator [Chelatococcus asaccharovorans]MBS7706651.1 Crp/Fnr family transcriptional regulator [Chelatococcus asaccharovorans]PXW64699.1 CRP-like cAMP-binding protein [Chelatococcus asaccharovorans]CAH1663752.1 CRP-like cAMP-binding protein [Chelatococcus asaccharovorans]CAH1682666.1 CRP-like cAMP-binding protein [Chelatococcus asaccharovorans]